MSTNTETITKFYKAFQNGNSEEMISCYHDEIVFEDPVFRQLKGNEAKDMWRMLLSRAKDLQIEFSNVNADSSEGSANWEAIYTFTKTGRKVHNKIRAHFQFRDGKIIRHTDYFNFWKWSRMALGSVGLLLGFTPLLRNKVSNQSLKLLQSFRAKKENQSNN